MVSSLKYTAFIYGEGAHHSVQVGPEDSLLELVLSFPAVVLGLTLRSSGSAPSTLIL